MLKHRLDVIVGVVMDAQGRVLIAKRHAHQHQGDSWEFPGGKIEPTETHSCALKRELLEEVGIKVVHHTPWLIIEHNYPDKAVRLNVHKVTSFTGHARGCEGQTISWVLPQILLDLPLPKANERIVQALQFDHS